MTVKLSTTVSNIERDVHNSENRKLLFQFYEFMKKIGTSERYQNNNLKATIAYSKFLDPSISFNKITEKSQIVSFLDTKMKSMEDDPDKRWITTWNDYLGRIKYFFRWMYNCKDKTLDDVPFSEWKTPDFVQIKKKSTKRISPYLENELWEKEDLLTIIKYESYKRNKAVLALLWDLDARPHEIVLLKIKHIRLKEKYGEGEIPYEAKTGTGPILLTMSFPYVRDWLNEHPFKNEPNARLICNLINGSPITSDSIDKVMKQLRDRIIRLLEADALKSKLKQIISPRILHIATHGFFFDSLHSFNLTSNEVSILLENLPRLTNSLLRSGLALAGANSWVRNIPLPLEAENGIITAEDILGINFSGTDLVVLSACDTGLGEILDSEGVFGLRRSFVVSGVKTLIMSLWKVPDKQTTKLMITFYQNLLDGYSKVDALHNAQLEVRKKYSSPYYWGAFICQGDPNILQSN